MLKPKHDSSRCRVWISIRLTPFIYIIQNKTKLYGMVITYFLLEKITLTVYIPNIKSIIPYLCGFYDFGVPTWRHFKFVDCYARHQQIMLSPISFILIIYDFYLIFKLYCPNSNQSNVYSGWPILLRFHQFGVHFVSDAKHWHHAFDFFQKIIGSKKLWTMWGKVRRNLVFFDVTNCFRLHV